MELLNWFYALLTLLITFIVAITIWSRKEVKYKIASIILGVFSYLISYGTMLEILSRPKPKNLELLNKYANDTEDNECAVCLTNTLSPLSCPISSNITAANC